MAIPAAPMPEMARPAIKTLIEVATPQMSEPCTRQRHLGGFYYRSKEAYELEDGDGEQENPFVVEDGETLAPDEKERCLRKEVRTSTRTIVSKRRERNTTRRTMRPKQSCRELESGRQWLAVVQQSAPQRM